MRTLPAFFNLIMACLFTAGSMSHVLAQAWTSLADVPVALAFPVVVELNGNIHVIGGGGPGGATDIHLRYTPGTNTWDTLQPVPYKAQQPGGAVAKGRIHYFGGGYPNSGTRLDDHYAYNPGSDTWVKMADLPIPRVIHKTATLGDTIYALSGQPDKSRVDIFTPSDSSWKKLKNLPDGNFWYCALAIHDNTLYRFGGGGSISAVSSVHSYNQRLDDWTSLKPLEANNHAPSAGVLGDSIYVVGGYSDYRYSDKAWVYNVKTNQYGKGPTLPEGRSYHTVVSIRDCIYSVGGHNDGDKVNTSLIRHCLGDDFTNVSARATAQKEFSISLVDNKHVRVTCHSGLVHLHYSLFTTEGKIIFKHSLDQPEPDLILEIPELSVGIYILRLWGDGLSQSFQVPIGQ